MIVLNKKPTGFATLVYRKNDTVIQDTKTVKNTVEKVDYSSNGNRHQNDVSRDLTSAIEKAHGSAEHLRRLLRIEKLEQLLTQRHRDSLNADEKARTPDAKPVNNAENSANTSNPIANIMLQNSTDGKGDQLTKSGENGVNLVGKIKGKPPELRIHVQKHPGKDRQPTDEGSHVRHEQSGSSSHSQQDNNASKKHKVEIEKHKEEKKKHKSNRKNLKGKNRKYKLTKTKDKNRYKTKNENSDTNRKHKTHYKNKSRFGNKHLKQEQMNWRKYLKQLKEKLKSDEDNSKIEEDLDCKPEIQQVQQDMENYADILRNRLLQKHATHETTSVSYKTTTQSTAADPVVPTPEAPRTGQSHMLPVDKETSLLADQTLWLGMAVGSAFSFVMFIMCCCFYKCLVHYRSKYGVPLKGALGLFKASGEEDGTPMHITLSKTGVDKGNSQYVVSITGKKELNLELSSDEEEVYNRAAVKTNGSSSSENKTSTPKAKRSILQ